jgi:hypothetical protein
MTTPTPAMHPAATFFFVLMLSATFGLAAIAWTTRLVVYPMLFKTGRKRFLRAARYALTFLLILTGPLMLVELVATLGFIAVMSPAIERNLGWASLLLLAIAWGVTLFHHRPAARVLSRGFDPAAMRRLLCAQWVRAVVWSFRGVVAVMMLLRAIRP